MTLDVHSSNAADGVVFGLSHIDVPVRDLDGAKQVYCELLGFVEKARGQGWLDLDAGGTVTLRLLETPRPVHRAALRVLSDSVEGTLERLVRGGCERLYPVVRTPEQELVGSVRDPFGNTISVWRALTEDEWDFVPELPKQMTWAPDADELLKSLLKKVPVLFRALARRRIAPMAEELAAKTNFVTREEVIRGFILASPRITRGRNRQPLVEHGIDVDRYQVDWDAS